MTAQDWIDLMPIVADRGWIDLRLHGNGVIRDREERCPICALAHEISGGLIDHKVNVSLAVRLLTGRTPAGAAPLVDAADNRNHPWRQPLMVALGMRNREKRL